MSTNECPVCGGTSDSYVYEALVTELKPYLTELMIAKKARDIQLTMLDQLEEERIRLCIRKLQLEIIELEERKTMAKTVKNVL